jgi:hypothetical protein
MNRPSWIRKNAAWLAVWQHGDLFIEGEHHAVLDPGEGKPFLDCTPHKLPNGSFCQHIVFIPMRMLRKIQTASIL